MSLEKIFFTVALKLGSVVSINMFKIANFTKFLHDKVKCHAWKRKPLFHCMLYVSLRFV